MNKEENIIYSTHCSAQLTALSDLTCAKDCQRKEIPSQKQMLTSSRKQRKRLRQLTILRRLHVNKRITTPPRNTWKITKVDRLRQDCHLDLIQRINNRAMHDVIEQIFGYLDYDSLTNAEQVSAEWNTILDNERIWKALLKRNLASNGFWRILFDLTEPRNNNLKEHTMTKLNCKRIGELQRTIVQLLNSCLNLIACNMEMLSLVTEMLSVMGFINICEHNFSSDEE